MLSFVEHLYLFQIKSSSFFLHTIAERLFSVAYRYIYDIENMRLLYKRLTFKFYLLSRAIVALGLVSSPALWGQSDPLATGEWKTLRVKQSSVITLSQEDFKNLGFDVSTIDPRDIRVFSNMGVGFPAVNPETVFATAPELPLYLQGEEDGVFNENDIVQFYIQGPQTWYQRGAFIDRKFNLYTDEVTLYIGYDAGVRGERIKFSDQQLNVNAPLISRASELTRLEKDLVNPLGMGNWWLGEKLGNQTLERAIDMNLNPNADSTNVSIYMGASMVENTGSILSVIDGNEINVSLRSNFSSDEVAYPFSFHKKIGKTSDLSIQLKLNRPNIESSAYIDYIVTQSWVPHGSNSYCTPLQYLDSDLDPAHGGTLKFSSAFQNATFWDVSDPYNPKILAKVSVSDGVKVPLAYREGLTTLIIDEGNNACNEFVKRQIANKTFKDFQYRGINNISNSSIYICPPKYKETLLSLNWSEINTDAAVVTTNEIYNQYSGGQADLGALRAFIRYLYNTHKNTNGEPKLKYVTLVGSASYDFGDRLDGNTNDIPIYQSNGIQKTTNYCLDDYLGYLEPGEGDPELEQSKLNVVVGRIPARNATEITNYFEKIVAYNSDKALGAWRNRLSFVADDIDEGWEREFTLESEDYADYIQRTYPYLRVNRIYADAYAQQTNGNNEAYPEVTSAIKNAFEDGSLFINYQGHGGESGWAQESIFDIPTINGLSHNEHFPVLFTATCEFSRFDNPSLQSAGEKVLVKKNGGAIALMTTTRTVWSSGNSIINDAFWKQYGFPKKDEPIPTLGELYSRLKNRPFLNSEDYKFALLGDPSLKLAFPEHLVTLDSVNDKTFVDETDTLKAFSVVKVKGHIDERLKGLMSDFNGRLYVNIYDKPVQKSTLDNDGVGSSISYKTESSVLFNGVVSVINGAFEFTFAVPKDISYQLGKGRAIFYAENGSIDAAGAWRFNIGGSEDLDEVDSIGPTVKTYMGDTFFRNGGEVLKTSEFVARVYDESGLNSTGAGIGRDMVAVLDPGTDSEQRFVLNEFFQYDPNSFQTGQIILPLNGLSPGWHEIECKVWDIYNNSGVGRVRFKVIPEREVLISNHKVYPNPFQEGKDLHFSLQHNLVGEDVKLDFTLYNIAGSQVYKMHQDVLNAQGKITVDIDLPEVLYLSQGMYFYRIELQSMDGLLKTAKGKWIK